jgi:uncharacterized membrane protein (UPF0127 family)
VRSSPRRIGWLAALALLPGLACGAPEAADAEVVWVAIGGETFQLELALDSATRHRGLSGRDSIPRNGGMLFAMARSEAFAMVMRDCSAPIDVAFLDSEGRVIAIHEMQPEPPRRRNESPIDYERRLRAYPSGGPARFAIETAGGRLGQVGLAVGQRLSLDTAGLVQRAR